MCILFFCVSDCVSVNVRGSVSVNLRVMNKELKEQNRKGLQRSMVVVMAGDDSDEQRTERTERTEQKGFAAVDVLRTRCVHAEKRPGWRVYVPTISICKCIFSFFFLHARGRR